MIPKRKATVAGVAGLAGAIIGFALAGRLDPALIAQLAADLAQLVAGQ